MYDELKTIADYDEYILMLENRDPDLVTVLVEADKDAGRPNPIWICKSEEIYNLKRMRDVKIKLGHIC